MKTLRERLLHEADEAEQTAQDFESIAAMGDADKILNGDCDETAVEFWRRLSALLREAAEALELSALYTQYEQALQDPMDGRLARLRALLEKKFE